MTTEELEKFEKYERGFVVCECFDVTLGTLLDAVEAGHNTLEALMDETDAGTACELCQSKELDADEDRELHLTEILEYVKAKKS